jgi:hypothetical protein
LYMSHNAIEVWRLRSERSLTQSGDMANSVAGRFRRRVFPPSEKTRRLTRMTALLSELYGSPGSSSIRRGAPAR